MKQQIKDKRMRNFLLIWLLLVSIICTANPITQCKAKEISEIFMARHSSLTRVSGTNSLVIKHVYRSNVTGDTLCYVFGRSDGGGFVIASADDSAEPILGYSDTEIFDPENMAPATRWWLENYQKQIEYASKKGLSRITREMDTRHDIAPMIETKWNQENPYNTLCPYDNNNGKRSMTGCVATATAQLMYYHKWPERGTGSHSYEWNGEILSADFGNTYYQWDKMKKTYYNDDDTDNAIATLMYHCGVALDMKYGAWVSWAYFNNGEVMSKYFGYSPYYTLFARDYVGDNAFETALYNDLANGLPVLYGGQDKNRNEGHQFICDGYREGGFYHMNWGWGGWNDGYFLLSALNISDGRQWNWEQVIYCGINKYEKETEIDGLIFEDSGCETATLIGGNPIGNFVVPNNVQINGRLCKVTAIGKEAFRDNTDITSLTIPTAITNIGDMAFRGCANLREITMEDNAEYNLSFGNNVFEDCNIEKAYVGRDVTNTPLREMKSLKTVNIGSGVTTLNDFELFATGVKTISIPSQVEIIGKGALGNCLSLLGVEVNKNNSKYKSENGVLYNKEKTEILCYPAKKDDAKFICPASIVTILPYAFYGVENLTEIIFQTSLNNIYEKAFLGNNLKSVTIVNGTIPSCEENSFEGDMLSNATIYVPKGFVSEYRGAKGWNVFNSFMELSDDAGGFTYSINGSSTTITGGEVSGCIIVPNSISLGEIALDVTAIDDGAFKNNTSITDVIIPSSVKRIGEESFWGCSSLESLTVKDSETELICGRQIFKGTGLKKAYLGRTLTGCCIFENLSSLSDVILSNNVKSLPSYMFYDTGLKTINIPGSVDYIDSDTFYKAQMLEEINIDPSNTNYSSESGALYDKGKTTLFLLPYNSKITDFEIPESVVIIKCNSISGNEVKSIVIPAGIQIIETNAIHCYKLERVYINNPIPPSVNEYAFPAFFFFVTSPTLYVPIESLELYKEAKCWSRFPRIVEIDYVGIESILFYDKNSAKIYSIDGKSVQVKDTSPNSLRPGVYIINGHKVMVK